MVGLCCRLLSLPLSGLGVFLFPPPPLIAILPPPSGPLVIPRCISFWFSSVSCLYSSRTVCRIYSSAWFFYLPFSIFLWSIFIRSSPFMFLRFSRLRSVLRTLLLLTAVWYITVIWSIVLSNYSNFCLKVLSPVDIVDSRDL